MADLAIVRRLSRVELVELVSVLAFRLGALRDDDIVGARLHAAERHVEQASAVVAEALDDYVRTRALYDRAVATGHLTRSLSDALHRAARRHGAAGARERAAWERLGRLRMEASR